MDDLIYNQRKIPRDKWRYGFRTSAATGCGWIAVYNALRLMGYRVEPEKLIRYFERQLPLLHGNIGTLIPAPAIYFKQQGFGVSISARRENFNEIVNQSDVCVLFYRWHEKWALGAHFVTLHKKDGQIVGYNTYRNSQGPDVYGTDLNAFLKSRRYYLPVLIGIRDKKRHP